MDNVDEILAPLFLKEANAVLNNICEEMQDANCDRQIHDSGDIGLFVPSRLELFKALLPNSVLEKVWEAITVVLVSRNRRAVELSELMAIAAARTVIFIRRVGNYDVVSRKRRLFSDGCCC